MLYTVVTSINKDYWENHAVRLNLQSWDKFFPTNVKIHIYSEDMQPADFNLSKRVIVHNLYKECPELVAFIEVHKDDPHYNGTKSTPGYKWNAIKFAHKTFPIFRQARDTKGVLIWLDADVLAIQPLAHNQLRAIVPENYCVNYLGRPRTHSECGYVTYNLDHQLGLDFIKHFESYYYNNKLSTLLQTHDSYVFDRARESFGHKEIFNDMNKDTQTNKHPFDKTVLNQCFVHTKGDGKDRRIRKNAKRFRLERFNLHPFRSDK